MNIGFIGLGIMGSRMAENLLKAGKNVTVFNRSKNKVENLTSLGASVADSPIQLAEKADIVITMLSTPEVVADLAWGKEGFLQKMKKERLWIDCSTVNPSFSKMTHEKATESGIRFLDAPVAGTKPHAENGELVFFVGGEEESLKEAAPLFEIMGKKTIHVGSAGMGSSFKMLVNAMLAQGMLIFAETMMLGEKMGLDKGFLLKALPGLVVSPPFLQAKSKMIEADDYGVQFPLKWMHKDMHLVAQTAYEVGQPLYLANIAKEVFAEARMDGYGELDFAAIYQYIEKKG